MSVRSENQIPQYFQQRSFEIVCKKRYFYIAFQKADGKRILQTGPQQDCGQCAPIHHDPPLVSVS